MPKAQYVRVLWGRPKKWDDLKRHEDSDREVLYAIIGTHKRPRKSGKRTTKVFYIGQTRRKTFQRLSDRQHPRWLIQQRKGPTWDLVVRVGQIEPGPGKRVTRPLINDVEAALIYGIQPSKCSKNRKSYSGRTLKVLNRTRSGKGMITGIGASVDTRRFGRRD